MNWIRDTGMIEKGEILQWAKTTGVPASTVEVVSSFQPVPMP